MFRIAFDVFYIYNIIAIILTFCMSLLGRIFPCQLHKIPSWIRANKALAKTVLKLWFVYFMLVCSELQIKTIAHRIKMVEVSTVTKKLTDLYH